MDSTCFMFYDAKYLCFAPGWAVYGVWCEMYQVTVLELWLSGFSLVNLSISLLWLANRPMCSCVRACYCDPGWHQWHLLTPDTNCFHLSLQSYQESLTNTNWHVIPSMWEKWRMFELRTKWRSHASCGTLLSQHDKCPHAYLQSFCQNFHNFNPFMQNFLPSLGKVWFNCSKKLESWIKVQKFLPKYQLLHQPNLI